MNQLYLSEFAKILLFILAAILFVLVAFVVSRIVRPHRPNPEKLSSYETGEDTVGSAWSQFNIRFYIVALIFLLFEVEIVFLFPWSIVFANQKLIQQTHGMWGWYALAEMVLFIVVLVFGLAYAWVNGHLDWIKPSQKPTEYTSGIPKALYDKLNEKYK